MENVTDSGINKCKHSAKGDTVLKFGMIVPLAKVKKIKVVDIMKIQYGRQNPRWPPSAMVITVSDTVLAVILPLLKIM
jgi:hypothetical protein